MTAGGCITLLMAGRLLATPFGSGGSATLQGVLDGITTAPILGDSSVNVETDFLPDGTDARWAIQASGGSFNTVIIKLGSYQANTKLGIYDPTDPNRKVEVFGTSDQAGAQATISIKSTGEVYVNLDPTGTFFQGGNCFGYYYDSTYYTGGGMFYSDTGLNPDGKDHQLAYQGNDVDWIATPGNNPGVFSHDEYIFAWEDLIDTPTGASDFNYADLVFIAESVNPCPDSGATVALLGASMLGLIALRRRIG